MSRFTGLSFASSAGDTANALRASSQAQKAGTNYHGRRGLRSLMDKSSLDSAILDRQANFGGSLDGKKAPGVYNLAVLDDSGTAMKGATINIGGKLFTSDSEKGKLRILDPEYINEEIQYHEEVQAYELKIVKAILVSNTMAQTILGDSYKFLPATKGIDGMAGELVATEATPDAIAFLDPTSAIYSRAVAKIKMIVHKTGIVLNQESEQLKSASSNMAKAVTSSHDA